MTVITEKPLTFMQMFNITRRDALYITPYGKARIMNASPDQETEVDQVIEQDGYRWGLRKVAPNKKYDYLAMRIK